MLSSRLLSLSEINPYYTPKTNARMVHKSTEHDEWKSSFHANHQEVEMQHPYNYNMWKYFQPSILKLLIVITFIGILPIIASAATPTVDAGPSRKVIITSTKTTTLNGKGSDADGPVTFQWSQTRGNVTAALSSPTSATTTVTFSQAGSYTFKLTVRDNSGNTRTDTTNVSVFERWTFTIQGIAREALVHPPTGSSGSAPVVLCFHGNTGTDDGYSDKAYEMYWPQAIVVYPQGLPTNSVNDKTCRKPSWQLTLGEINCKDNIKDQDIIFFDAILTALKNKYSVNSKLVFVQGWSTGGNFIFNALWPARRSQLAALAVNGGDLETTSGKQAIPVIQTAGTQDELLAFSEQQADNGKIRTLNKCSTGGTKWASGSGGLIGTRYSSSINAPVVWLQYNGPHAYPGTVPPLIIKFFKEVAATITSKATAPLITKVVSPPSNENLPEK